MKNLLLGVACLLVLKVQALEPDQQRGKEPYNVTVEIKLTCPMSEELTAYVNSVPPAGERSTSLSEWQASFVNSMNQLIHLVESGKMSDSVWSSGVVSSDEVPEKSASLSAIEK